MAMSIVRSRRLNQAQRRACPPVCVFTGDRCELLAQLCYPVTPEAFMRNTWQQRALAVHGPSKRMEAMTRELLHGLVLRKLLRHTPSEDIHVWFAARTGGASNESFKTPDAEAALSCHRSGGSLYFRAPPELSELSCPSAGTPAWAVGDWVVLLSFLVC